MTTIPSGAERGAEQSPSQTALQSVIVPAGGCAAPNSLCRSSPSQCLITSSSQYVNRKGSSHLKPTMAGVLQWQGLGGKRRGQGA